LDEVKSGVDPIWAADTELVRSKEAVNGERE
jgi:hypothetical protein